MLLDEVDIKISAGHGGPGRVSFMPGKKSGPDGGDGGRGGDVYIEATTDLFALNQFSRTQEISAEDGEMRGRNKKTGGDGKDLTIKLPIGCELVDKATGKIFTVASSDQKTLICKGGIGGLGNAALASSRNTTPLHAQKGLPGQFFNFKINLKLIADFGLIGLPNAGKSSLLNELTNANAKVAGYPFTTLEPNLGVINGRVIADIPGLIEGASDGKGLGIRFLKHIERVSVILHCISAESEDLVNDYKVVRKELENFSEELTTKKEIILLTKTDLIDKKEVEKKLKVLEKLKEQVIPVSIHDFDSLEKLKLKILQ